MKRKYENFTLEEFKFIYFMEWSHRYAGRITGLGFALPLVRSSLATSRPRRVRLVRKEGRDVSS
jgi:heme A synthase